MPNYVELGADSPFAGGSALFRDGAKIRPGRRTRRIAPKELQSRLTTVGGLNPYGEPRLRLIWGWTPTDYVYNRRERHYETRPPMLPNRNRWIVEQWFPAEYYGTPQMFRWTYTQNVNGEQIDLLGPYPSRGRYEHLVTVERAHKKPCSSNADVCSCGGGYVELTPQVCDDLVGRLRIGRDVNAYQKRADTWTKIQEHYDKNDPEEDAIIDDIMPAFRSRQHAVIDNVSAWKGAPGGTDG